MSKHDIFEQLGHPRFLEGEVVRLRHENGGPRFWHLRFCQEELGGGRFQYHGQAVPVGVWPGRVRWLLEEDIEATGLSADVLPFEVQDSYFLQAGRGTQLQARSATERRPLPQEEDLARVLEEWKAPVVSLDTDSLDEQGG